MIVKTASLTSFVVTCSHAQTGHAQASAAFQAAQHTQHTQHAQHGAGFVMPPPPPPAIPNFSNAPRSFAVTAQPDTWNRGEDRIHDHDVCADGFANPKWPCFSNHEFMGCLFCRHASNIALKLQNPAVACHQILTLPSGYLSNIRLLVLCEPWHCAASLQQPCHSLTTCLHKEPDMQPLSDFLYNITYHLQQAFQSSACRGYTCHSHAPGPRAGTGLPHTAPGHPQVTAAPASLLPSPFPHAACRAALPPHSHPHTCQLRFAAAPLPTISHGHRLILTQNRLSQSFGIV